MSRQGGGQRERISFKLGEFLLASGELVTSADNVLARRQRLALEAAPLGKLGAKRAGALADDGKSCVEQCANPDEFVDRAFVGQGQQGGAAGHGGEPGEERGDRALLMRKPLAARGDQRSDHFGADIGGADARFGGRNRGDGGGLGGAQLARVIVGAAGRGLEPGDLAVGVGGFGPGAGQLQVDRLGGGSDRRAARGEE